MTDQPDSVFQFNEAAIALSDIKQQYNPIGEDSVSQHSRRPPSLTIPSQGSDEYKVFDQVYKGMQKYTTINDIPYHIKVEIEELLNQEKFDRTDWRGVASRLDMKGSTIEKIEGSSGNRCKETFEQLSHKTVVSLLQMLYQMERHDILNSIHKQLPEGKEPRCSSAEKREVFRSKLSKHPSQESTPDSSHSMASYPSPTGLFGAKGAPRTPASTPGSAKDSGIHGLSPYSATERTRSDSIPIIHSDGETHSPIEEHLSTVDFHSEESKRVWKEIAPNKMSKTKTWRNFEKFLREEFREESGQSQLLRFICYVLKIGDYEQRENKFIQDQDFANMVAWFGPFKSGKDGCFEKMNRLMKGSINFLPNTGSHSFFAGYMTKDEADNAIKDGETGTFLIRFSSTNAAHGSFVVVLKTPDGTEHHEIKQSGPQPTGKVEFDGKTYGDLVQLYSSRLCRGGVSANGRTSCTTYCRDLPLNVMFKSYLKGPVMRAPRGRGRGRASPAQE